MSAPLSLRPRVLLSSEIVTVGIPFCAFKLLTGVALLHSGALVPLAYGLLAMGAVDLALNLANLIALVAVQHRVTGACLSDVVLRKLASRNTPDDLGLAIDVFVSFALVAIVIGFGLLARLPHWALMGWNAAVVLNVLGAGVGRLLSALRRPDHGAQQA